MFGFELYKALRKKEIWLFIAIGLVLEVFIASRSSVVIPKDVNLKIYKYYLEELEGEYTDEKNEWLTSEHDKYQELIDNQDVYEQQYADNEITAESYRNIRNDIQEAQSRKGTLEYLVNRSSYLGELNESSGKAQYFYDLEINDYVEHMGVDIIVIILIIVIVVNLFGEDYNCGTDSMVSSSVKGRRKLYVSRFFCMVLISLVIGILFPAVEFIIKNKSFDLGNMGASIRCITSMSECGLSLTIGEFLLLGFVFRVISALMFGIIVMGITVLVQNTIADYVAAIAVAYLPYIIFDKAGKLINVFSLCKGFSPFYGFKQPQRMFGMHGMVLWFGFYMIVCAGLLIVKRKKQYR